MSRNIFTNCGDLLEFHGFSWGNREETFWWREGFWRAWRAAHPMPARHPRHGRPAGRRERARPIDGKKGSAASLCVARGPCARCPLFRQVRSKNKRFGNLKAVISLASCGRSAMCLTFPLLRNATYFKQPEERAAAIAKPAVFWHSTAPKPTSARDRTFRTHTGAPRGIAGSSRMRLGAGCGLHDAPRRNRQEAAYTEHGAAPPARVAW